MISNGMKKMCIACCVACCLWIACGDGQLEGLWDAAAVDATLDISVKLSPRVDATAPKDSRHKDKHALVMDAPKPDAPKPDAPKPDAPKPDMSAPDKSRPDVLKPDKSAFKLDKSAFKPDMFVLKLDMYKPDTRAPDTRAPDTIRLDTRSPDTRRPDTRRPDTRSPDTRSPDTRSPDTRLPDDAMLPDVQLSDTRSPDTRSPDTRRPDTRSPDTQKPSICGNGKAEPGERCDGKDLRGLTCSAMGAGVIHYHGTNLFCDSNCEFYVKNCYECGNANKMGNGFLTLEGYEECEYGHDPVTKKQVILWKDGKDTCAKWGLKGTVLHCAMFQCLVYCT